MAAGSLGETMAGSADRLTASRFAEHPCGGAARPAKISIAPKPSTRLAPSVEDPRPFQGTSRSTPFGAPEAVQGAKGEKRSGGGPIELLGSVKGRGSLDSI